MKQYLSIFLLMCFSLQCVLKLGIVAWYETNKSYIATVLCENKDKPQLKCCGKCYLRKKLNDAEGNNSNRQLKLSQVEWSEFLPVTGITLSYYFEESNAKHFSRYNSLIDKNIPDAVFHPPAVASIEV